MTQVQAYFRPRIAFQLAFVVIVSAAGCQKSDRGTGRAEPAARPSIRDDASLASQANINLLQEIILPRDQIKGVSTFENGKLVVDAKEAIQIALPVRPTGDYRLVAKIERVSGFGPCRIGVIAGNSSTMLVLEGWDTQLSGLDEVDGQSARNNSTTYRLPILPRGKPITVECTVRKGFIGVLCDGKNVIEWKGDPLRLSVDERNSAPGANDHLTIGGGDAEFHIMKLELITTPGGTVKAPWLNGRADEQANSVSMAGS